MFWNDLQGKSDGVFRRLTGVRRATFERMAEVAGRHLALRRWAPQLRAP